MNRKLHWKAFQNVITIAFVTGERKIYNAKNLFI